MCIYALAAVFSFSALSLCLPKQRTAVEPGMPILWVTLPLISRTEHYDVVLDAMFGFGFKGDPRPPFDTILQDLSRGKTPVVSVDVPSGWSVSVRLCPDVKP